MQQGGVILPGEKLFTFKLNNIEISKISSLYKLNTDNNRKKNILNDLNSKYISITQNYSKFDDSMNHMYSKMLNLNIFKSLKGANSNLSSLKLMIDELKNLDYNGKKLDFFLCECKVF